MKRSNMIIRTSCAIACINTCAHVPQWSRAGKISPTLWVTGWRRVVGLSTADMPEFFLASEATIVKWKHCHFAKSSFPLTVGSVVLTNFVVRFSMTPATRVTSHVSKMAARRPQRMFSAREVVELVSYWERRTIQMMNHQPKSVQNWCQWF